jgi:hypothetical protein
VAGAANRTALALVEHADEPETLPNFVRFVATTISAAIRREAQRRCMQPRAALDIHFAFVHRFARVPGASLL